uniref:Annexin n=1 Tax=Parascaris equorum TaxID=6256 RepID=A0A914S1K7_PAREQ
MPEADFFGGVGTKETVLIDILCTRSSQDLEKIKNAYSLLFGKSLEDDVIGDTSGDFQQLLVGLLECTRDQSDGVDVNAAREDAKRMLGNKLENLIPDKEAFKFAFTISRSEIDLAEIKVKFEAKYHKSLVEFIKSDCSEAYSETLITV